MDIYWVVPSVISIEVSFGAVVSSFVFGAVVSSFVFGAVVSSFVFGAVVSSFLFGSVVSSYVFGSVVPSFEFGALVSSFVFGTVANGTSETRSTSAPLSGIVTISMTNALSSLKFKTSAVITELFAAVVSKVFVIPAEIVKIDDKIMS